MILHNKTFIVSALVVAWINACSDPRTSVAGLSSSMEPAAEPRVTVAETPREDMSLTPGNNDLIRFNRPYLHCGSAQTVYNPVAGFFGIGTTYKQALERATNICENGASMAFIEACVRAGGTYNPALTSSCVEMIPVHSSDVPVDFYNVGGGVYSDSVQVCRTVYCSPKRTPNEGPAESDVNPGME